MSESRYDSLDPIKGYEPRPLTVEMMREEMHDIVKPLPPWQGPTPISKADARMVISVHEHTSGKRYNSHVLGFVFRGDFDAVWAWGTR